MAGEWGDRGAGTVLVVGADGTIGAAVAARLEATGGRVIRTSRRGTPGSMPLDLAAIPASWQPPVGITAAILCAAVTSTDACRNRPEDSRLVNVDATIDLGRRLADAGIRLVFPSTNMVFDGSLPLTPASAIRHPRTAYGRMKAEAEDLLLALAASTTVVRLSKVIGMTLGVFERWRESLARGEPIRPLADLVIAPVPLTTVATVLAAAARDPLGPVLQFSASADVSYAAVASRLAARWGAAAELVQPATAAELRVPLEHLPPHTTLDTSTVRDRLGIEPPDPWEAIDACGSRASSA
jgi:dTDP-4-dehydrorhamnose reductase